MPALPFEDQEASDQSAGELVATKLTEGAFVAAMIAAESR